MSEDDDSGWCFVEASRNQGHIQYSNYILGIQVIHIKSPQPLCLSCHARARRTVAAVTYHSRVRQLDGKVPPCVSISCARSLRHAYPSHPHLCLSIMLTIKANLTTAITLHLPHHISLPQHGLE